MSTGFFIALKLINQNRKHKPSDWAFVERSLNWWSAPKDGGRRLAGYANDAADPANPLYSTNPVTGNMTVNWLEGAWFQDDDGNSQLARWDYANGTFVPGPTLMGDDADGFKLRPISITRAGTNGLYVVAHDGSISYWDGTSSTFTPATSSMTWLTRTPTTDLMNTPDLLHYGYGNLQDLYSVLDTLEWDGTFTDYASSATAITHPNDPPGFGGFWSGRAVWVEKVGGVWHGLWHGPVWGDLADPTPSPSTQYACLALLKCVGGNPASHASWQDTGAFLYPFAPYDVDALPSSGDTAGEPETQYLLWRQMHGDTLYFWADPQSPGGSGLFLKPALYYLAADGTFDVSLSYPAANCYGGPMCEAGGDLYAAMVLSGSNTLRLYKLDTAPDTWAVESDTAWSVSPHRLGSMYSLGDYVHIGLGRDVPGSGTGSGTAWEVMTYRISTGAWTRMAAYYPPPAGAVSDTGTFIKMFAAKGTGATPVFPPPGSGPCDEDFSPYGTSTITEAGFTAVLTSYHSPFVASAHTIYSYGVGLGVNMAFVLAALYVKESQCGSVPGSNAPAKNVGNIRATALSWSTRAIGVFHNPAGHGDFAAYSTWLDGALDVIDLAKLDIYYNPVAHPGVPDTLSEFINTYAPAGDEDNNPDLEIAQTCARMSYYATLP